MGALGLDLVVEQGADARHRGVQTGVLGVAFEHAQPPQSGRRLELVAARDPPQIGFGGKSEAHAAESVLLGQLVGAVGADQRFGSVGVVERSQPIVEQEAHLEGLAAGGADGVTADAVAVQIAVQRVEDAILLGQRQLAARRRPVHDQALDERRRRQVRQLVLAPDLPQRDVARRALPGGEPFR